jgi:hypothetical protein
MKKKEVMEKKNSFLSFFHKNKEGDALSPRFFSMKYNFLQ